MSKDIEGFHSQSRAKERDTREKKMEDNQGVRCFVASGPLLALASVLDGDRRRDPARVLIVVITMPVQGTRMVFQLVLKLTVTSPQLLTTQACLTSGTRIRGLSGRAKLFNL